MIRRPLRAVLLGAALLALLSLPFTRDLPHGREPDSPALEDSVEDPPLA